MASRRLLVMLPLLALILAGCFRQASEPAERVAEAGSGSGAVEVVPPTLPPPVEQTEEPTLALPTETVETPTEGPTATVEPTPTAVENVDAQSAPATETATTEPTATILPPSSTPFPSETAASEVTFVMITSTPVPQATNTSLPTATSTAAPVSTSTPTPSPTAQIEQPGLITPGVPNVNQSALATPTPRANATSDQPPLVTPTDAFFPDEPTQPAASVEQGIPPECVYVVRAGDNLFRIALNNGTSLDALIAANPGINPQIILPGDEIILPDCGDEVEEEEPTAPAQSNDSNTAGGETTNQDNSATNAIPLEADDQGIIGGIETIHVVQPGETLSVIARRYGVTITAIAQRNNIGNANRLTIGQRLVIPPPASN